MDLKNQYNVLAAPFSFSVVCSLRYSIGFAFLTPWWLPGFVFFAGNPIVVKPLPLGRPLFRMDGGNEIPRYEII